MKAKLAEIEKETGVSTKYLVADFFQMTKMAEYQEAIGDKLAQDDVALVFLNAGVGQVGPFCEVPAERLQYVLNINAVHPMYTAKVLVN